MATALRITNTIHVDVDTEMTLHESWLDPTHPRAGFELGHSPGNSIVWIEWEAVPRLCHLLMEVYARRERKPAAHTIAAMKCAWCNVEEGAAHIFGCPVLSLAEDR